MARILLTQGELKQTLGIVRELGKNGHTVSVLSMGKHSIHGFAIAAFSKYCKKHFKVSTYSNELIFINELLNILKSEKFDFVIPVGAPFVLWLTKHRDQIEQFAKIPFPESSLIEKYEDKQFTSTVAISLDIPVPKTIYPSSIIEAESAATTAKYPLVIKAIKEVGGNIVDYANSFDEFKTKYNFIVTKNNLQSSLPMIQEYLTGGGVGFFGLYKNGECCQSFQHRRIREFPISGGSSCCAASTYDERVEKYGKKILKDANWNGVAMVEFKYNNFNEPCLLEVNPKFWGSYDLSSACGVNFAHKLICMYMGITFKQNENYNTNLVFSWPYNGDIIHCWKKGSLWNLSVKILTGKIKTNTNWSDWQASMMIRINWIFERGFLFFAAVKKLFKNR